METVVCLSTKNSRPGDYVEIGVDAEDYYRIKDLEYIEESYKSDYLNLAFY